MLALTEAGFELAQRPADRAAGLGQSARAEDEQADHQHNQLLRSDVGHVTLGHGHDEAFWAEFCAALRRVGYDDVLSIEHEDTSMTPEAGVRESVELIRRALSADHFATGSIV